MGIGQFVHIHQRQNCLRNPLKVRCGWETVSSYIAPKASIVFCLLLENASEKTATNLRPKLLRQKLERIPCCRLYLLPYLPLLHLPVSGHSPKPIWPSGPCKNRSDSLVQTSSKPPQNLLEQSSGV